MILASVLLGLGLVAAEDVTVSTNKVRAELTLMLIPTLLYHKDTAQGNQCHFLPFTVLLLLICFQGKIQGERVDYEFGQYYYAFKGIPYAKPPVKELRFKAPVETDTWTETLQTIEDGNLCPQYDISQSEPIGK